MHRYSGKIDSLIHFTNVNNIAGILSHGLLPRNILHQRQIGAEINDYPRWDGNLSYSCFTANRPNTRVLYSFTENYKSESFVCIIFSPKLLDHKEVKYFSCNAAKDKGVHEISKAEFLAIAPNQDIQAEIQISGEIERKYIDGFVLRTYSEAAAFMDTLRSIRQNRIHRGKKVKFIDRLLNEVYYSRNTFSFDSRHWSSDESATGDI